MDALEKRKTDGKEDEEEKEMNNSSPAANMIQLMRKSGFVQKAEPTIASCFHQCALLGKLKTGSVEL